jgi:hypothetical protein
MEAEGFEILGFAGTAHPFTSTNVPLARLSVEAYFVLMTISVPRELVVRVFLQHLRKTAGKSRYFDIQQAAFTTELQDAQLGDPSVSSGCA